MAWVMHRRVTAAHFLVVALVASSATDTLALVSCGAHFARSCTECSGANGAAWCNGDCEWVSTGVAGGQCAPGTPPVGTQNSYNYGVVFVLSGIIMLIYACVFNRKVIKSFPKVNSIINTPQKGLFDCIWHPHTCLHVTFCMPVVAAKNYYATDVCPFWPGCILTYLGVYSPLYCITALVRAILSGRVQDKLGVKSSLPWNCLVSLFCFPCDVGRESLEVDMEVAADFKCCCQVTYAPAVVAEVEKIVEKTERQCGCWEGH